MFEEASEDTSDDFLSSDDTEEAASEVTDDFLSSDVTEDASTAATFEDLTLLLFDVMIEVAEDYLGFDEEAILYSLT